MTYIFILNLYSILEKEINCLGLKFSFLVPNLFLFFFLPKYIHLLQMVIWQTTLFLLYFMLKYGY